MPTFISSDFAIVMDQTLTQAGVNTATITNPSRGFTLVSARVTCSNGAGCEIYKNAVSGPNKVADLAAVGADSTDTPVIVDTTNNVFSSSDNIVILCTDGASLSRVTLICNAESPNSLTTS